MFLLLNTLYFTLLLFCAFVAFAQWRLSKDVAIVWYVGYLLATVAHHVPQFGRDLYALRSYVGPTLDFPFRWDEVMSYVATACYLMFIHKVLDIRSTMPRFSPVIISIAAAYGLMVCINLSLQAFSRFEIWNGLHQFVRLLFFPILIWLAFFLFSYAHFFYQKLILLGTLALLAGFVSAVLMHGDGSVGEQIMPNFIHRFSTQWGYVYLYDVKVGIMADVICFSWALTLRQKMLLQAAVPLPTPQLILPFSAPDGDVFLEKLDDFLNNHFTEDTLHTKEVAQRVFLSRSQLNRRLKEKTGMTVEQYLLRYRLERALGLLQGTSKTVSEIVIAVGMKDLSHFSRAFKKQYGQSPTKIRQNNPKNAD